MASDAQSSGGGVQQPLPETSESPFDALGRYIQPGPDNVMLIYVLFLAGLVPAFGAVPIIVGFILALLNRGSAEGTWASHYEFQYRTAAIGLLFIIVSSVLLLVVIGVVGFILTVIWWIVRSVKGLQAASKGVAIDDPKGWSW